MVAQPCGAAASVERSFEHIEVRRLVRPRHRAPGSAAAGFSFEQTTRRCCGTARLPIRSSAKRLGASLGRGCVIRRIYVSEREPSHNFSSRAQSPRSRWQRESVRSPYLPTLNAPTPVGGNRRGPTRPDADDTRSWLVAPASDMIWPTSLSAAVPQFDRPELRIYLHDDPRPSATAHPQCQPPLPHGHAVLLLPNLFPMAVNRSVRQMFE